MSMRGHNLHHPSGKNASAGEKFRFVNIKINSSSYKQSQEKELKMMHICMLSRTESLVQHICMYNV